MKRKTLRRIVIAGAGGHGRVMLDLFRAARRYEVVAFVDADASVHGTRIHGVPVRGSDDALNDLRAEGIGHAAIGVGMMPGGMNTHRRVCRLLQDRGFEIAGGIHPAAWLSPLAETGCGVAVLARASIGPGSRLGDHVVVNTGAIVEHDCVVREHSHVATGATLCGGVRIGSGVFVGAGAVIREGVRIADGVTVGAGALVLRDIPKACVVAGVPARRVSSRRVKD